MSIDRSLRLKDALVRHRNVLTRAERIEKLQDEEKWEDGRSVLGLPKVGHRKAHTKKVAKAKEEGAEGAVADVEGAPAAAGAAPAAPGAKAAPAAKAGAPAAKAAAPAAGKPAKEAKKK
ncbi:MAG: small basic protein [Sedimentisphaerales bacterium]|jgi:small basic protein (TIGR04137 family)